MNNNDKATAANKYLIYGVEMSPYSIKVRSYFRYKGIEHQWIIRSTANKSEFEAYAKLPIIPLVVTPDKQAIQDSTPILEKMEMLFPSPAAIPSDPVLAFLSHLLEEYADEWANKYMFHYRWLDRVDQDSASLRLADLMMPRFLRYVPIVNSVLQASIASAIKKRMSGRLWVVGSNEQTGPQIETSFHNLASLLQRHLSNRKYLFGAAPSCADFALWGQLANIWQDPTGRKLIEKDYAGLRDWINCLENPKHSSSESVWETWAALEETLLPLLKSEVGETFLPWTSAITKAMNKGQDSVAMQLNGKEFSHSIGGPQKYHVKSLKALRAKYAILSENKQLQKIMQQAACVPYLQD